MDTKKILHRPSGPVYEVAVFVLLLVLAATTSRYEIPLMDDVYITLQHTRNLIEGRGFSYFPDHRILVTTSPVHALLLVPFGILGADLTSTAVFLFVVFLGASGYLAYRLVGNRFLGMLAAVLVITEPSKNGVVGMETSLFVFTCFLALWLMQRGHGRAAFAVVGLSVLVRPDGVFLAAGLGIVETIRQRRIPVREVLCAAIPVAAWSAFAIPYFGNPLPRSFVAKYHQGQSPFWGVDTPWFLQRIADDLTNLPHGVALGLLTVGTVRWIAKRDRLFPLSMLLFLVFVAGSYAATTVPSYANYFHPFYAVLYVLSFLLVAPLLEALERSPRTGRVLPLAVTVGAFVLGYQPRNVTTGPAVVYEDPYWKIGEYLRAETPPDTTVAVAEIGTIGFTSRRKLLDFAGLATPSVARALGQGNNRGVFDAFEPDYVVTRYPSPWQIEGLTEEERRAHYEEVSIYSIPGRSVGLYRSTELDVPEILSRLESAVDEGGGPVLVVTRHPIPGSKMRSLREGVAELDSLAGRVFWNEPVSSSVAAERHFLATFEQGRLTALEEVTRNETAAYLEVHRRFDR